MTSLFLFATVYTVPMSTKLQHLIELIQRHKSDIRKVSKKLFLAAVVLFSLSWAILSPIKDVDSYLVSKFFNQENTLAMETMQMDPSIMPESFSGSNRYISNTLGSMMEPDENAVVEYEADLATVQNNALISQSTPITLISQKPRDEIISYVVQQGDTQSTIAAQFGISLNTLLWANNLNDASIIRPGDELKILPVTGLEHRVKDGDTVGTIATKYKANTEKIISINDLPADGKIVVGDKLIIPDGVMPIYSAPAPAPTRSYVTGPGTGKSRAFPYGQCTWYVAQKRYVPWSGHAKTWLVNARAYGFITGSTPEVGAIMVTSEGGWLGRAYGHVSYVEAINGSWITVSEMNYNCWACKSVRTLSINDSRIRGYIY